MQINWTRAVIGAGIFFMRFVIDASDVDAERTEQLIDIVLSALSLAPFEYSEQEVGVALCNVLALLLGDDDNEKTLH